MKLLLQRSSRGDDSTVGVLHVNGVPRCFTLEDERREVKVKAETRIPAGTYEITLRAVGGFHGRYLKRYGPAWHKGMLWLRDVPGFEYILIHIGNSDKDTAGCLLVGESARMNSDGNCTIQSSRLAYQRIYPEIAAALVNGERVTITIEDEA